MVSSSSHSIGTLLPTLGSDACARAVPCSCWVEEIVAGGGGGVAVIVVVAVAMVVIVIVVVVVVVVMGVADGAAANERTSGAMQFA